MTPANIELPTERDVQRAILKMIGVCFPETLVHHFPNGAHEDEGAGRKASPNPKLQTGDE